MSKTFHEKPFDDGTITKLSIFDKYLKEWLPVFLSGKVPDWNTINIFDFFSGPGHDCDGNKGTPFIIIDEIANHAAEIKSKNLKINLYFNDNDFKKSNILKEKIAKYQSNEYPFNITVDNLEFQDSFKSQIGKMKSKNCANLVFLDQFGIKEVTEENFITLTSLKRTDFIMFISSSTLKRFTEHPGITEHIKLDPEKVKATPFYKIHRLVVEYYKSKISKGSKYYLGSFSLKKVSGLYGLIFGSGHLLGIEKFIKTCWSIDPERGEANFDIDDDRLKNKQLTLWGGDSQTKPKKIDGFELDLKEKILQCEFTSDKDVYLYMLECGMLKSHASKVISDLIKENKIKKCKLRLVHDICKPNSDNAKIELI